MTKQVRDDAGAPLPVLGLGGVQKVSVGTTSQAMATAFASGTEVARVAPNVDCHLAIGTAPTATANDHYLAAGTQEYIKVAAGQKIAFIKAGSTDGFVTVTELE